MRDSPCIFLDSVLGVGGRVPLVRFVLVLVPVGLTSAIPEANEPNFPIAISWASELREFEQQQHRI